MTNKEMEVILRRAGDRLPCPAKSTAPALPERAVPRRRLAVALAVVLMAVLCSATVYAATTEISGVMPMWRGLPTSPEKYGLTLEYDYGDLEQTSLDEMWVVPPGTTYLEAMSSAAYRWISIDYRNDDNGAEQPEDRAWFSIGAGPIDHPYWRTCFSMDEQDVPDTLHDMTAQNYRGYTLYCGTYVSEDTGSTWVSVKWIDYAEGFVYSFSFHGAMENKETALEFTKKIIDGMR